MAMLMVIVGELERADGRAGADRVEQLVGEHADGDALAGVEGPGVAGVPAHGVRLDRHGKQRGDEETPVQHGDPAEGERDGQRGAGERRQGVADGLGDHGDVVGDPGGEVAGAGQLDLFER